MASSPPPSSSPSSPRATVAEEQHHQTNELSLETLEKGELIQLIDKLKSSYEDQQFELHRLARKLEHTGRRDSRASREHNGDLGDQDGGDGTAREEREDKVSELEHELNLARDREAESRRDQERMEEELAGRIEVLDKLRGTVRELERDKRDSTKRYREQADSFDSERQSWYDQEQHYKLRIQNLSTPRRSTRSKPAVTDENAKEEEDAEEAEDVPEPSTPTLSRSTSILTNSPSPSPTPSQQQQPQQTELETSLLAQLATLSTAHTSLSTTLRTLQTEMSDLKRVYKDLQEENESYEILLGEKTLSGEVTGTDFFRKSFSWGESGDLAAAAAHHQGGGGGGGVGGSWSGFGFQGGLEAVGEEDFDEFGGEDSDEDSESESGGEDEEEDIEKILLESKGVGTVGEGAISAQSRQGRRRSSRRQKSIALAHAKRDSTSFGGGGGGLDLAAELEAAQKEQELDEAEIEKKREKEEKREKKREERERKKREARAARRDGSQSMPVGIEELHLEIKQLREANKALTLYVSKIVDRVCSQEGFEKVLAVDYRTNNTPKTETVASPTQPAEAAKAEPEPPAATNKKPRPVSTSFFGRSPNPATKEPQPSAATSTNIVPTPSSSSSVAGSSSATASGPRRSGGLTWDGLSSVFGFGSSSSPSISSNSTPPPSAPAASLSAPGMKPFMLSSSTDGGGPRRLSISDEDEDDIIERERLRVDMSRHGIEYAPTLVQIGSNSGSTHSRPRSSSTSLHTDPSPSLSSSTANDLDPIEQQAEKQLKARQVEEETIRQQMKEGRGSGLTDAPPRRMNKLERRHSSRASSISYNLSPNSSSIAIAGLGIDSPSPIATSGSVSPAGEGTIEEEKTEQPDDGQKWTKALRRMSRGWSSPPVS